MKKFYSFVMLLCLSIVSMAASAATIIINVDDISRVYYSYNYNDYEFANNGDNTITVDNYASIYIKAKSGNFITKVVKKSTNSEVYVSNMTDCYIYNGTDDGETYTVTSVSADDVRDASCTVTVDNAAKVNMQRYNNTVIDLVNGENTVKFSTTSELPLTIQSKQSQPLYQVLLNNEVQAPSGSYWRISPANGDKIEVKADFPDQDESVTFEYSTDEAKSAITSVAVDGVEVTNYNDADFKVKCGSKIDITFNNTDYQIKSLTVNDNVQSVGSSYSTYITGTTKFVLDAAKNAVVKMKLTITDPAHITLYKGYSYQNNIVSNLVSGENIVEVPQNYNILQLKANAGCFITSISDNQGTTYTTDYNYCYTIYAAENLEVTVVSGATVRDAKCTVTVDDASLVNVVRSNNTSVSLTNGDNNVEFSTESELPLRISSSSYKPLYKVTLDGIAVEPEGSYYLVSPANGSKINITAILPDEDESVKFVYSSDEAKGIISRVTVDGTEVTNFNDEDFTVKCGQQIGIFFNTADYKLDELKMNDVNKTASGSFYSYITAPTTFSISAHKYGNVKIKLNITDPEHITVYKDYYYNGNTVNGLTSGENTIEVPENNNTLQFIANSGCYITSVSDNQGNTYTADYSGYYTINATKDLVVTVVSGKISRDKNAVIYIDDTSAAQYGLNVNRSDRNSVSVSSGYNAVEFYDGDNPFTIQAYGSSVAKLYRNGEEMSPEYAGGTSFKVSLSDGDVVKFYVKAAPSAHNVTLTTNADPATAISVIADHITAITDLNSTFSALTGTEVTIAPDNNNTELEVTANGETVTAADGKFTVTVTADTNVTINAKYSGISTIEADAANGNVYNTQGVMVLKAADANKVNSLPAGIYIMGGKKIVVK